MLANSFGQKNYVEKTINVEMNLNHARSLWGFIKICLEQQEQSGRFVMSQESAIKVINAWESLAKAIDGADKVPSKDAYGTVTIDAEVVE
jgi:hypothetical protein